MTTCDGYRAMEKNVSELFWIKLKPVYIIK